MSQHDSFLNFFLFLFPIYSVLSKEIEIKTERVTREKYNNYLRKSYFNNSFLLKTFDRSKLNFIYEFIWRFRDRNRESFVRTIRIDICRYICLHARY